MKKIISQLFLFFLFCHSIKAQELGVTITNATAAANALVGSNGITISNATFNGDPSQLALVTDANGTIGFNNGILLTTGQSSFAHQSNQSDDGGQSPIAANSNSDPDLATVLGGGLNSAAILEFDFTTTGSHPSFQYVFLSEEYNNYAPSSFHDGFAFFISGLGISGPFSNHAVNIALVPGTTSPVSVNTVNSCTHNQYYQNNCIGVNLPNGNCCSCIQQQGGNQNCAATAPTLFDMQIPYNGFTQVLPAKIILDCNLITGATYHCKIVIANVSDQNKDSGVILKAGSLNSDLYISPITAAPQPICEGQPLTLSVQGSASYNYSWSTGQSGAGLTSITTNAAASANPYSVIATNQDGCHITENINAIIHTPLNIAPYVNGVNNTGNYIFYAQAGYNNCFYIPTFDTPGEDVHFTQTSNLPFGATFTPQGIGQQTGLFCWIPSMNDIGDHTFTVHFHDNNACGQLADSADFIIRIGCGSCVPNVYYQNRTPSNNPLPAFTKAGNAIIAGQNVDPNQTVGLVNTGTASVTFKAGIQISLDPGFTAGPGFTAYIDPNTCVTDCEDCCSHFPGITYDFIPNYFTPNGDGQNDIWFLNDHNYPFCAYNAQYFDFKIVNRWGDLIYHQAISSTTCCPFRAKSNASDPTIPSINWNGLATETINYSLWDQIVNGKNQNATAGLQVSDGVYFYTLTIGGCGAKANLAGFIEINPTLNSRTDPTNSSGSGIFQNDEKTLNSNNSDSNIALSNTNTAQLILYPNPADDQLNVMMMSQEQGTVDCIISICNYQGIKMLEQNAFANQLNGININQLSKGVYILKIVYDSKLFTKTFIKS